MLVCVLNTLCGRYGRAGDEVNHAGVLGAAYQPREGALPPREFWGYLEQPRVRGLRTLNWEQPSAALCDEILTPGDGQVRALICNGGNPAVAFPGQEKVVRALESLDLLVCLDVHLGPTARLADYVFGCKLSLEKPDYTRHLEWYFPVPFAQYTPAIIEAEGDVIDEWELFWGLAHRMRVPLALGRAPLGPPVANPRPVDIDTKPTTDELMEIEAADARVPLAEVKRYPSGHVFDEARVTIDPPNAAAARFDLAPELFLEDLGRVIAEPVVDGGGYRPGERYTHRLASRRLRQVFNSTGTHLPALNRRGPGNPAYLGPDDMRACGLSDGDRVEISSEHGRIVGVAWTDPGVPPGVVSMAHAWGSLPGDDDGAPEAGACTNRLVANDVDFEPLIGQARQSAIPVNLRPLTLREESSR
jgi:anaerobic selenocysteine-containing dehydrogenase